MYKLKITTPQGHSAIAELSDREPYTQTLRRTVSALNITPCEEAMRLVFVTRHGEELSMQTMYSICCAVQAVLGNSLVWDVEAEPLQPRHPQDLTAYLNWSPTLF